MNTTAQLAFGTRSSVVVENCQICDSTDLEPILFLGYLPPVNQMPTVGTTPAEQPSYPALLLRCRQCDLVQIGLVVDPQILFPPEYPYTSGTTRILRENFAEQYRECTSLYEVGEQDLVVDIASNDGTLLSNWAGRHRVQGVEPADVGNLANERGIPTRIDFFTAAVAEEIRLEKGPARVITICNAFAHIENIHSIVDGILRLLDEDGIFISESHYLVPLLQTLQYDTVYHEHLRYYSLRSLAHLLEMHGLEIIHAKAIPTHGGSIRVYAARRGKHQVRPSVNEMLATEDRYLSDGDVFEKFKRKVVLSKLKLHRLLLDVKAAGGRVYGIGAPSRASTLINYVGLDDGIVDAVMEIRGSHKIGKYIPGTMIPVLDEQRLFDDQPEFALLFSWHIADELIPKLVERGFKGQFIVPLPEPRVVSGSHETERHEAVATGVGA